MKNTMIEMVSDLEAISDRAYIQALASMARGGDFHDYRSKEVCGKRHAVECIDMAISRWTEMPINDREALKVIRQKVIDGEYDEMLTDEDRKIVKQQALADKLMSEKDRALFFAAMGITEAH